MSRFLFAAFTFMVLFSVATAQGICPPNEVYEECGTACPANCTNLLTYPRPCTLQCVQGCFCQPGLIRNSDGTCVRPRACLCDLICS